MTQTIEQQLAERGYSHHRRADSDTTGKHDIFLGSEFIGSYTAHEASAFLDALREADQCSDEELEAAAEVYDRLVARRKTA